MISLKHILPVLLIVSVLVETPLNGSAQRRRTSSSHSSSSLSYGPIAGFAVSNLTPEKSSNTSSMLGFIAGGFFEYKFTENIGGQAEICFTQFGGEKIPYSLLFNPSSPLLYDVKSIDLSLYGIDIPLTAKYHFTDLTPEFYVNLGVLGTYILKAQAALNKTSSIGGIYSTNTTYVDVTKKVQDMQGSVVVGCGTSLPLGKVSIKINLSFQYGLTDLSANNVVANNGFNSKVLKMGVGLGF